MKTLRFVLVLPFLWCSCAIAQQSDSNEKTAAIDEATGMVIAEHWETTRNHCIVCHSPQQFLRQRGTRQTWTEIVKWMQESAGLWKLTPEIEGQIISYLTENYSPEPGNYRRAPIPVTLMPKNPYESSIKKEVEDKRKAGLLPSGPIEE